jgi:6-phosphogluconate dehydrogenase
LFGAKIISYAQGYNLMMEAAKEYKWNLNYGGIALMWRGGCIIRSVFLGDIKKAFDKNPNLQNLLLDPYFKEKVEAAQAGWRRVCATALTNGIPVPALTSALCYFDGFRSERLPANCCRPSATILARTLTNASTNHAANFSTLTGPAAAAIRRRQRMWYKTDIRH